MSAQPQLIVAPLQLQVIATVQRVGSQCIRLHATKPSGSFLGCFPCGAEQREKALVFEGVRGVRIGVSKWSPRKAISGVYTDDRPA